MRKLLFTLLFIFLLPASTLAYEYQPYSGYEYLKKVDEGYIKSQPRKMEKNWEKFCEVNRFRCEELHAEYYEKLFEAKRNREVIRQERMQQILVGMAAGAAGASNSYSQQRSNADDYVKILFQESAKHTFNTPTLNTPKRYTVRSSEIGAPTYTIEQSWF